MMRSLRGRRGTELGQEAGKRHVFFLMSADVGRWDGRLA